MASLLDWTVVYWSNVHQDHQEQQSRSMSDAEHEFIYTSLNILSLLYVKISVFYNNTDILCNIIFTIFWAILHVNIVHRVVADSGVCYKI